MTPLADRDMVPDALPRDAPLIEFDNVYVEISSRAGTVFAVNGVSFAVSPGEIVGIVGESGSGKTIAGLSALRLLPAGIAELVEGEIRYLGNDLMALSEREARALRGKDVAMIFQDPMMSLNPALTVGLQITEVLRAHLDVSRHEAQQTALRLLEEVGISDPQYRIKQHPHELSGGMRQRVMIAIALACDPKLIIADEPTTALDVTIQAQVLALLKRAVHERQAALMLITHDLGVVAQLCERVVVMYGGTVVEESPVRELFASPRHPYSAGLIGATPRLGSPRGERLPTIDGYPTTARSRPQACPFAPRCPRVLDRCRHELPVSTPVGTSGRRRVACFNPLPEDG